MRTFAWVLVALALALVVTLQLPAQEAGKPPQKVTGMTMAEGSSPDNGTVEKNMEAITREVTSSGPLVIIKALALAAAVGGLAYLYLGRSRKGKAR